jgi:L-threonylcarbamoyladenylate synthase
MKHGLESMLRRVISYSHLASARCVAHQNSHRTVSTVYQRKPSRVTALKRGENEIFIAVPKTKKDLARHGSAQSHQAAATTIARGGCIAFRTDTFYGLGVDPFNREAICRIKKLKGREDRKPILIVISDYDQLHRFIEDVSPGFDLLAKTFWPGALTLIGKARAEVPDELTAATNSIGVRLPDDERVRDLVRACGGALTATSANPSHVPPAVTAQQVADYFGSEIDLIVDGGTATSQLPSTVVDATFKPTLIREGVISWAEIESASQNRLR